MDFLGFWTFHEKVDFESCTKLLKMFCLSHFETVLSHVETDLRQQISP